MSKGKSGRPKEYVGPLSPAQAAAGMTAAKRNAKRLADDAKLLLGASRHPTAASIATLSIEESGKVAILREIAIVTSPPDLKDAWRRYRDHRSKNGSWIMPDLALQGAKRLDEFAEVVNRDGEHTSMLNTLKQLGFYTDCYGSAYWSEPNNIFADDEARLANHLVNTAVLLSQGKDITTREMEIWVECMRSVWNTPDMKLGLLRFGDAMFREGLSGISPADYADFIAAGNLSVSSGSKRSPTH